MHITEYGVKVENKHETQNILCSEHMESRTRTTSNKCLNKCDFVRKYCEAVLRKAHFIIGNHFTFTEIAVQLVCMSKWMCARECISAF